MKSIVEQICRAKREAKVVPALATELELKNELTRRGAAWTAETFRDDCAQLADDPDIICHRLIKYNGFSIKTE
jgi:hypothetical protein